VRLFAALLVAALAGCTCDKRGAGDSGVVSGELFEDRSANTLHALLFDRERSVGLAPCSLSDAGCLGLSVNELHRTPFVAQKIHEGGDEPLAFIGGEVDFLAGRAAKIETAAAEVSKLASPVAQVLLQNDLWERFDALNESTDSDAPRLRATLARTIRGLALPRAELEALPSNLDEVGRAYPALLPGWGGPEWLEIRSEYSEDPTSTELLRTTAHAQRWGHRVAFRVLARAPPEAGGAEWLRQHLSIDTELPAGTILALVGSPLAVSAEGEVVPLNLVTLIELRKSRGSMPAQTIGELQFDVLEGKRALLRLDPRPNGGLVHLPPETPLPVGATCLPDRSSREPLKGACTMCHGSGATKLSGPFAHGTLKLFEEKDPAAAAREVSRVKAASKDLAELRAIAPR
jgi:hypothetical protein